jgi:hypothetical protein
MENHDYALRARYIEQWHWWRRPRPRAGVSNRQSSVFRGLFGCEIGARVALVGETATHYHDS